MKIGIYTASTPIGFLSPKRSQRAIDFLNSKNHQVILGDLFWKSDSYRSGSIIERANEINQLLGSNIDILMSSIGGYNTSSILPFINTDSMSNKQLIVTGFSDSTSILYFFKSSLKNCRVLYGPALVPSFGDFESEFLHTTYESMMNRIQNKKIKYSEKSIYLWSDSKEGWEEETNLKIYQKNKWMTNCNVEEISGRLFGGNLNSIISSYNESWYPKIEEGDILLIEDSQKSIAEIERNISWIFDKGWHTKISAIILSKHELFDDLKSSRTSIDVLNEFMDIYNIKIPIIYNTDFGHTRPMIVLELFKNISINFLDKEITQ
ncbi:hypothetical protein STIUS_v1c02760 [Spiroplasma sp. TIUS-1]|uniref:LD-carboxypeptidase n=1 Tax=Spiroplasma sp. TIUS-1 TaxID=216963 RepID=UPI0013975EA2|nr:LD-carboxypeptidase [Spiroplasma sp. TIUS-1]QHX35830.1 hypothetical protein STIUS_v1c02760 [Spiroplasma sp. TIUS-1]